MPCLIDLSRKGISNIAAALRRMQEETRGFVGSAFLKNIAANEMDTTPSPRTSGTMLDLLFVSGSIHFTPQYRCIRKKSGCSFEQPQSHLNAIAA